MSTKRYVVEPIPGSWGWVVMDTDTGRAVKRFPYLGEFDDDPDDGIEYAQDYAGKRNAALAQPAQTQPSQEERT